MTLGEKLYKLRRENNYTQEELADMLNVTRQSISKWEADTAYPETDKLIKLGELYGCSMDYLLKDDIEKPEKAAPTEAHISALPVNIFSLRNIYFEKKSKIVIGGLPLWHINIGLGRRAKGIFAVGLCATGIVSVGLLSLGVVSVGLLALGLLALGTLAIGLLAAGAISVGVIALGAICFGFLAVGALSVGQFSIGALSIGKYLAIGDNARALIAIGKTEAVGSLFAAPDVTNINRAEIFALLDKHVPIAFAWIKELIKLFL